MFSCDGRVVDEKERDGDEDRNDMGGYEGCGKSGVRPA